MNRLNISVLVTEKEMRNQREDNYILVSLTSTCSISRGVIFKASDKRSGLERCSRYVEISSQVVFALSSQIAFPELLPNFSPFFVTTSGTVRPAK